MHRHRFADLVTVSMLCCTTLGHFNARMLIDAFGSSHGYLFYAIEKSCNHSKQFPLRAAVLFQVPRTLNEQMWDAGEHALDSSNCDSNES